MAPKGSGRHRSTHPKTKPPGKVRQRAPEPDSRLARKEACVAALQSLKKGADRAMTAYNELAHKRVTDLEAVYQQHRADQARLRSELMRLCGTQ